MLASSGDTGVACREPAGCDVQAKAGEPQGVYERALAGVARYSGPGIALPRLGHHRAGHYVSEAQVGEGPYHAAVFVVAGGQPDGVGDGNPRHVDAQPLVIHAEEWSQRVTDGLYA